MIEDNTSATTQQKPAAQLEEDDEFEDFPVEGTVHNRKFRLSDNIGHRWFRTIVSR